MKKSAPRTNIGNCNNLEGTNSLFIRPALLSIPSFLFVRIPCVRMVSVEIPAGALRFFGQLEFSSGSTGEFFSFREKVLF